MCICFSPLSSMLWRFGPRQRRCRARWSRFAPRQRCCGARRVMWQGATAVSSPRQEEFEGLLGIADHGPREGAWEGALAFANLGLPGQALHGFLAGPSRKHGCRSSALTLSRKFSSSSSRARRHRSWRIQRRLQRIPRRHSARGAGGGSMTQQVG